jgi:hypothetical protein
VEQIVDLIQEYPIDALEVHTRDPRNATFASLWQSEIGLLARKKMKLVAISMPEPADWSAFEYVARLVLLDDIEQMQKRIFGEVHGEHAPGEFSESPKLLWQCDGKPMTGDLGARGTTRATVQYAARLADYLRRNPNLVAARGFVQCAGGTNEHTVPMLRGIVGVHGVAYGSYARRLAAEGGYEAAKNLVQQVKKGMLDCRN